MTVTAVGGTAPSTSPPRPLLWAEMTMEIGEIEKVWEVEPQPTEEPLEVPDPEPEKAPENEPSTASSAVVGSVVAQVWPERSSTK